MKENMRLADPRPVTAAGSYDVIVVGGGVAGIAAAVAAARSDMRVLLLEKGIILGGLATAGLISWYEPLCDGNGKKMIGGISEELIRLSVQYGFDDLPKEWKQSSPPANASTRYATHFSPTMFALALDRFLLDNGVTIRLDCLAAYPVMEGSHCAGIVAEEKNGKSFFAAGCVVDATGDAQILHTAGMPTRLGENFLTYVAHRTSCELAARLVESKNMAAFRKWEFCGSDLNGKGHPADRELYLGETGQQITDFVLAGRRLLFDKLCSEDRTTRDITMLPSMPQFRTIRHIVGDYVFTGCEEGRQFDNAIGSCGDFRSRGKHYQIPYSTLYHRRFDNMLAAGRIISASGDGWEITRVIPVAALTGQAAGQAAALSIRSDVAVSDIDVHTLQKQLADSGVLFVS